MIPQPEIRTARDQLHGAVLLVRRSARHLWKAGALVAVVTAAATAVAIFKPRIFLSESVILYRRVISASYLTSAQPEAEVSSTDIGLRLREILLSRTRLERLIRKHKLYPNRVARRGYVDAVERMRLAIQYRTGGGGTFHVAFKGPSPEIAQRVTADLAESLIDEETKLRAEQVSATQRFLEAETNRLQAALQKTERTLAEFLAEHPEFAQEQVSGPGTIGAGASVRAAQVRSKAAARRGDTSVHALRRQANRLRQQLTQGLRLVRVPPAPELVAAKDAAEEELRESQGILARKETQFTEKHPDVVAARSRVEAAKSRVTRVRKALATSKATRRRPTAINRDALRKELSSIEQQIAASRSKRAKGRRTDKARAEAAKANSIVVLETAWNRLNRQVREARSRYLRIEARQFRASLEASSELAGQASHMRIIDPAYKPRRPAGVGRTMIVLGGFAVACMLGCLLLLGLSLLDERVYDRLDIERRGISDVLVEIPRDRPTSFSLRQERPGMSSRSRS